MSTFFKDYYEKYKGNWDKLGFLQGIKNEECRKMVSNSFDDMAIFLLNLEEPKSEEFIYLPFIRRSIESYNVNRVIKAEEVDNFFRNIKVGCLLEYIAKNEKDEMVRRYYDNIYNLNIINDLTLYEFICFIHNEENESINLLKTLFRGIIDLEAEVISVSSLYFSKNI